jgi:hypothetical protein
MYLYLECMKWTEESKLWVQSLNATCYFSFFGDNESKLSDWSSDWLLGYLTTIFQMQKFVESSEIVGW